jgi:BlaI family penicillinase repressor
MSSDDCGPKRYISGGTKGLGRARLGPCSVREIQESFPERGRPAYTTVQTVVYRLERNKALRRAKKIGNAYGSRMQPLMAHLIESGRLTLKDVREAEETLQKLAKKRPQVEQSDE